MSDGMDEDIIAYIVSKYGTIRRSIMRFEDKDMNVEPTLVWRNSPKMSCKFSFIRFILEPRDSANSERYSLIDIQINNFKLTLEVRREVAPKIFTSLKDMHTKAMKINNLNKDYKGSKQMQLFRSVTCETVLKEEQLMQLSHHLKQKEACMVLDKVLSSYYGRIQSSALTFWVEHVKEANDARMRKDRDRWRLHAAANQEIDLQAWYHALFYQEVSCSILYSRYLLPLIYLLINPTLIKILRFIGCVENFFTKMQFFQRIDSRMIL